MKTIEQEPHFEQTPELAAQPFMGLDGFDFNAAFQEAMFGVASDAELELEEKVRRMEVIVSEGTSDVYREFVDFRQMAAQMEMMCNHNHALGQSVKANEALSDFMKVHLAHDGVEHSHDDTAQAKHTHEDEDDEYVIDPVTGRRRRKRAAK